MSLSRLLHLLSLLLAAVTAVLVARTSVQEWRLWQQATWGARAVARLQADLLVAERISFERGPANALLGADRQPPDPERLRALAEARARSDAALHDLAALLAEEPLPQMPGADEYARSMALALASARALVDAAIAQPQHQRSDGQVQASVNAMVALVPLLTPLTNTLAQVARQAQPTLEGRLQTLRLAADLREQTGLLGSLFTSALAGRRPFTDDERQAIERACGRISTLQSLLEQRLGHGEVPDALAARWADVQRGYFEEARERLVVPVVTAGRGPGPYPWTAAQFADRYVPRLTLIVALRDALQDDLQAQAAATHRAARRSLALVAAASVSLVLLTGYLLLTLQRRVLRPLGQITDALQALARNELDAPLPRVTANDEGAAVVRAVRALQQQTQARQALERERDGLIDQLRAQSLTDALTGLPNRRAFFEDAAQRMALAQRQGFEIAVAMLDVDAFKAFNDRAGHTAGDAALRTVAAAMRAALRTEDLAARYGGEEFVMLFAPCPPAQALPLAERVRAAIAATPVPLPDGGTAALTASLGVAVSGSSGTDLEQLLSAADEALYRAKRAGRNRVMQAEEDVAAALE